MITLLRPWMLVLLILIPISIYVALPRFRRIRRNFGAISERAVARATGNYSYILNRNAIAALVVRSLLIACIVGALAGVQTVTRNSKMAVAFLVDVSDSVGQAGRDQAVQWVRDAMANMRLDGNDQAAVVMFGGDAFVERALSGLNDFADTGIQVRGAGTNFEQAIRLGLSLLPSDSAKRIVLLSDGRPNSGDADVAARLARASNARLDAVLLPSTSGADAAVERIEAPQRVTAGQQVPLQISVRSSVAQRAQLSVLAGVDVVATESVNLNVGNNVLTLRVNAPRPGFSAFRVQLTPERDSTAQNNALSTGVIVGGPPKVLLVSQPPAAIAARDPRAVVIDELVALKQALTSAGIEYEETTPRAMPSEIQSLASFQSVVLVNVPARELSQRTMQSLQSYVRDIGGGLVTLGGPNAYGLGGYFKTTLEEILPVDSQVKDPRRFPSVSIVIVMDKSGSMGIRENGVEKMRIANEAAARVAELSNDDDEVTVIAFDTTPVDVIGPFTGADRARNIPRILSIATGGGGIYIYESMLEAQRIQRKSNKLTKFVIMLADGNDSEHQAGARELMRDMRNDNVVMTVVAIGDGSDIGFLKELARIGEGRYHFTDRAANLPSIFTEETAIAQRSYLVEETFVPRVGANSPIMQNLSTMPALLGYVASVPKASAQVVLKTPGDDPILATWQYGLGRSASFMSVASGRWGRQWVGWSDFPKFWAQTIRWTIIDRGESQIQTRLVPKGDVTTVVAELPGSSADGAQTLKATLLDADGNSREITLSQTAPGRYEADTTLTQSGAYFVRVASSTGEESTTAYAQPYSPEYTSVSVNGVETLRRLTSLADGEFLSDTAQAFDLNAPAAASRADLSLWLLALAALLFPLDIGVRRIAVSARRLAGRIRSAKGVNEPQPAFAGASTWRPEVAQRTPLPKRTSTRSNSAGGITAPILDTRKAPQVAIAQINPQAAATASALLKRKREQQQG